MERGSTSTSLDRSPLAAWLDLPPPGAGRAEPAAVLPSLGRWLGWKDAIALSAALHGPPLAPRRLATGVATGAALARELAALRATQQQAIGDALAGPVSARGRAGAQGPAPGGDTQDADAIRQRCAALQRAMAESVAALRARTRAAAAAHSPALARLAALDAVMEGVLAEREQQGLTALCARLLRQSGTSPTALQSLLLAELEHRLQPVLGLLEALAQPARPLP